MGGERKSRFWPKYTPLIKYEITDVSKYNKKIPQYTDIHKSNVYKFSIIKKVF